MCHLFEKLREDHHLKHGGRMQLGLFLKSVGLTLDDALAFWKAEFSPKVGAERFDKEYAYGIRHNYGKEGKRMDYTPYSCQKIISSTPGALFQLENVVKNIKESCENYQFFKIFQIIQRFVIVDLSNFYFDAAKDRLYVGKLVWKVPKEQHTIEYCDGIYHKILGKDGHGYCKTYGRGVPWSAVYARGSGSSQSLAAPSFIDEITQRVTQDVESRFTTMIKNLTARVLFLESQGVAGSMSLREVSDASSGQQASKENE